MRVITETGRIH